MKAVHVAGVGGLEQLVYGDWPDPEINAGEVLVKVEAASVNQIDIWLRKGIIGPLPLIPGTDAAGIVAEVGADALGISVGDRVLLNGAITCDSCEYCLAGNHGTCRQRSALGQKTNGGYAEYVKVPWRNVLHISDGLSFEEAAAVPAVYFTAWQALMMRAQLRAGETVLITAAASGVGSAALQIAKLAGARVIAGSTSDEKLEQARKWGADAVINYARESLVQRALDLTEGKGPHVILDIIGGAYWSDYTDCVRPGGRIVTCSMASGRKPDIDILTILQKQITILGTGGYGSKSEIAKVVNLFNSGVLKAVIYKVFPLEQAALAQATLEDHGAAGKIILKP